ncbi:MAG: hypothetical protein ACR2KK_00190 [Acidimicrobiales bacterium]
MLAVALALVVVVTYQPPAVLPFHRLTVVRDSVRRVEQRCQGGSRGTSPVCYWTVRLGRGTDLGWPWSDPWGTVEKATEYLRRHGPVTVWFSGGQIYQIALEDGSVYIDYADAVDEERLRQWFAIGLALLVSVGSVMSVGFGTRRLLVPLASHRVSSIHGTLTAIVTILAPYLLAAPNWVKWWPSFSLGTLAGAFWLVIHVNEDVLANDALVVPGGASDGARPL